MSTQDSVNILRENGFYIDSIEEKKIFGGTSVSLGSYPVELPDEIDTATLINLMNNAPKISNPFMLEENNGVWRGWVDIGQIRIAVGFSTLSQDIAKFISNYFKSRNQISNLDDFDSLLVSLQLRSILTEFTLDGEIDLYSLTFASDDVSSIDNFLRNESHQVEKKHIGSIKIFGDKYIVYASRDKSILESWDWEEILQTVLSLDIKTI